MKQNVYGSALVLGLALSLFSCASAEKDPLPSWNNTAVKEQIMKYVTRAKESIPVEDRIAVFDMDGTIACETPLWFEMATAVNGLNKQLAANPELIKYREYEYAKKLAVNPADTSVINHWVVGGVNYIDSMVLKAYEGVDYESYIASSTDYLTTTKDRKFNLILGDMFYQPMLELIKYMKKNHFEVYIVSGSMSGVIWSICPQTIDLDRRHLIGTRQEITPVYKDGKTLFIAQKAIFTPKNDGNGKSMNIYDQIGKVPVFAFGNTSGDFGMFHLVSTSKYPHMALMLNHDDDTREYAYPPYHGAAVPEWQDSLKINHWVQVDMSDNFKTVFKLPAN
ncbi:HAD family hydrolase [uncultured Bacteroides sp.]|uniref:HAD family hydrolase n=1 Tax=uncultured Bacteroides sp. TaxID=162156 RepID=UPI002AAC3FE7|nr:HAD family hydrolase [uncultured Bacteroides sp.]